VNKCGRKPYLLLSWVMLIMVVSGCSTLSFFNNDVKYNEKVSTTMAYDPEEQVTLAKGLVLVAGDQENPLPHTSRKDIGHYQIIADATNLTEQVTSSVCTIAVTRDMVDKVDWEMLRKGFDSGTVIAGLGINLSELYAYLGFPQFTSPDGRFDLEQVVEGYSSYPTERWAYSYVMHLTVGNHGFINVGADTLFHPEFGWKDTGVLLDHFANSCTVSF